jgi:peroxiredoxin Q/BCP
MAASLDIGDKAPDFTLQAGDGSTISLKKLKGKKVVMYFYPRDSTPGCTREACSFNENLRKVTRRGAVVIGVSADSVESHARFAEKYGLSFPLLSDPDRSVIKAYGVWKEKNMYGKKSMGIERSTFIIDEKGKIQKIFRRVRVDGHTDAVLAEL